MIETTLLHGWATLVKCAALIAIVVLALGLIVRAVKLGNVMRHLGVIVGIMILLLMLPAIILSEWSSMSFFQQFGIAFLGIVVVLLFNKMRCAPKSTRRS